MVALSHLKSFQALELALRTGSLSGAAEMLAITPAAVGQRIKSLEDYLGLELLSRGRSGLRPTPELSAALPHLRHAFSHLEAAAEELDLQRGQELHLAAASDFVDLWLEPRLDAFRQSHPNVRFCVNGVGDAPIRLGKVDCTIGFGPLTDGQEADTLFTDFVVPICSPANLARTASLPASTRLEGFPLLHLDFYKDDSALVSWPAWIERTGLQRTAPERGIRFQRITAALDAVHADAGMTLCGLALLEQQVRGGRVQLPYGTEHGLWTRWGFAASYRPQSLTKPLIRRFRDWLRTEAANTRSWLLTAAGERES